MKELISLCLCMVLAFWGVPSGVFAHHLKGCNESAAFGMISDDWALTEESEGSDSITLEDTKLEIDGLKLFNPTSNIPMLPSDHNVEEDADTQSESGESSFRLAASQVAATIDEAVAQVRAALDAHETYIEVCCSDKSISHYIELWNAIVDHYRDITTNGLEGDFLRHSLDDFNLLGGSTTSDDAIVQIEVAYKGGITKQQHQQMISAVDSAIASFGFTDQTSAYDKIAKVYSYITKNIKASSSSDDIYHTAYSAIIQKKAVCQGYSTLLYYMMWKCGIPCRIISGTGKTGAHSWNLVWLRGQWYSLDSTWDSGKSTYTCFLKGKNSGFYNGVHLTDYDEQWHYPWTDLVSGSSASDYGSRRSEDNGKCASHVCASSSYLTDHGETCHWCASCGQSITEQHMPSIPEISIDKTIQSVGKTIYVSASADTASYFLFGVKVVGNSDYIIFSEKRYDGQYSFQLSETGRYTLIVGAYYEPGNRWKFSSSNSIKLTIAEPPANVVASTNKSTYSLGETVTITPSATGATYYAISVWDGGDYGVGNQVYYNGHFTGSISFTPEAAGTYGILCNAFNDAGRVSAKATFTVTIPLAITVPPQSVTTEEGGNAAFTVAASGTNLTYQWQVCEAGSSTWKDSPADGNKTATLTVPATMSRNGYKYRCVVKSGSSSVTSAAATLTVTAAVKITAQPKNVSIAEGSSATFSVTASGSGLTYQWQVCEAGKTAWKNSPAAGNKTATLTVPVTASRNGYKYRCVVKSSSGGSATSSAATLTVTGAAPKITVQPKSMTASAGTYVQFSVTASGSGLTYQWQVCEAGKTTWKNSPAEGNQTATLTVPVTAARNGYKYRCIVKSGSSSVTSDAVTLTVS